jgi:hypothetical protein
MDSDIYKGTCFICLCDCVVTLFKIKIRYNIREDIDFEQRKVGLLHRRSTEKVEHPLRLITAKGRSFAPTTNSESRVSYIGCQQ